MEAASKNSPKRDLSECEQFKLALIPHLENSIKKMPESQRHEWLRLLHARYSDRFTRDNDRIWTIANIFIPLSLAGLVSLKEATVGSTILLGFGSIGLIYFWMLFAENHRAFQNKSQAVVDAIESYIGLDIPNIGPQKGPKLDANPVIKKWPVNKMRWRMLRYIIVIWLLAIAFAILKASVRNKKDLPEQSILQEISSFLEYSTDSKDEGKK